MFDFLLQGFALLFILIMTFFLIAVSICGFCMILAILCETTDLFCRCHRDWLESKRESEAYFAERNKITV